MLSSRLVSIYQCQTASRREAGARARARACRGGRDRGRKWVWPSEEEERSRAGGVGITRERSGPRTRPCAIHRHHSCQTGLRLFSMRPVMQIRAVRPNISQCGCAWTWTCVGLSQRADPNPAQLQAAQTAANQSGSANPTGFRDYDQPEHALFIVTLKKNLFC